MHESEKRRKRPNRSGKKRESFYPPVHDREIFRKKDSVIFWAVFSAAFGLMFGALGSLVYIFMGGFKTAFAWWISGIPMDIIHCIGNFVIMLVLYKPLRKVLDAVNGFTDRI